MQIEFGFEKICVVGLGYIGLPTAAVIASQGVNVVGLDVSESAVALINQGKIHIVEPELDIVVKNVVNAGKLRATLIPECADAFMIAVPTPFRDGYKPDLGYIKAAAESIAPVLVPGNLIILESTVPVGATEKLMNWIGELRPDLNTPINQRGDLDLFFAHCPERVLPGKVINELISNDRLIGGVTRECGARAAALYEIFVSGELIQTEANTAELAKLTENSFRDVNIAFANELSVICDKLGIDVWELIRLANHHPRVNILNPGPGVGGHCIAVDPWFVISSAPTESRLIRMARTVNDDKPVFVQRKVEEAMEIHEVPVVACLGLAFKADIDDLRESPAVEITRSILGKGIGRVLVVEPNIEEIPESLKLAGAEFVTIERALEVANILVVLVDHSQFNEVGIDAIRGKSIIDTRGIWSS